MNIKKTIKLMVLSTGIVSLFHLAFAKDSNANIQQLLKERTNMDFKVISNTANPLRGSTFVIVESPSGERLALLANQDGTFVIPLADGIAKDNSSNELKTAINNVNQYNKMTKDKNVLAVFQKYDNLVLKIPANTTSKNTMYMVLDTTCPYCLQEVMHLDEYLKNNNLHIVIVGILGQKAFHRAAGYYKEFSNAKTREQKIALIKEVFNKNYNPNQIDEKAAKEMTEATLSAGVQGVPYIIIQ